MIVAGLARRRGHNKDQYTVCSGTMGLYNVEVGLWQRGSDLYTVLRLENCALADPTVSRK